MERIVIPFINQIAKQLAPIYQHTNEQEQVTWWLIQKLTGIEQATLLAHSTIELTEQQEQTLATWINNHVVNHMPLQYILGTVPFNDLEIIVEPPVLIPRPETEEWCLTLCSQLKPLTSKKIHLTILDLCTGTGCIALTLAKELSYAQVYATDIADFALALAKKNAAHNTINNVTFIQSDIYENIPTDLTFDLIVANPPYITAKEWKKMDPMVTEWEDKQALVAEHEGLAIIEKIIKGAQQRLKENLAMKMLNIPQLVIEIGYRQGERVKELMHNNVFNHIALHKDLEGKDRLVTGRM